MRGELLYVGSCQSQLASARSRNTYSSGSLSRGNTAIPRRGITSFFLEQRKLFQDITSLASSRTQGNLMQSPTLYTHSAHGCWDELN